MASERLINVKDLYFEKDAIWKVCVCDAYNAMIISGLYDFIKNNEIYSFMYFKTNDDEIMKKFNRMNILADIKSLHSGASLACFMRIGEKIIKEGFENWKYKYIEDNCNEIITKVKFIQEKFRESISNPKYKLCKRRLNNEYFHLLI